MCLVKNRAMCLVKRINKEPPPEFMVWANCMVSRRFKLSVASMWLSVRLGCTVSLARTSVRRWWTLRLPNHILRSCSTRWEHPHTPWIWRKPLRRCWKIMRIKKTNMIMTRPVSIITPTRGYAHGLTSRNRSLNTMARPLAMCSPVIATSFPAL